MITTTPSSLWDLVPKDTQGDNGVRLQYRTVGTSAYTDLILNDDYDWWSDNPKFHVPIISRISPWATAGDIYAHPAAVIQTDYDRDTALRVALEGSFSAVHISGSTWIAPGGSDTVSFYIYKSSDGWATPLWQDGSGKSFDLIVPFSSGEELFFSTNAGATDMDDWAHWRGTQIAASAVPEPSSAIVFSLLGIIGIASRWWRKTRST